MAAIVEHKEATPEQQAIREINTGVMAAPTARFARWLAAIDNRNASGEYFLTDVIALAVRDGVAVGDDDARASVDRGAGRQQRCAISPSWSAAISALQADALLDAGVTLADPARIDVRGTLACGRDVTIDVGCVFEGAVTLGRRRRGRRALRADGTRPSEAVRRSLPFSHIEDASIGAQCRDRAVTRGIRPATALADDVHIGNFVEVKASSIGARSKVESPRVHRRLDASAATSTSAPARSPATTTARTSIARSSRTTCQIGSDTQLVAPVTIGRGATIGAGTHGVEGRPAGGAGGERKDAGARDSGWKRPKKG